MAVQDETLRHDEEYRWHAETYRGFVRLMQYSVAGVVVVLALMALFLL